MKKILFTILSTLLMYAAFAQDTISLHNNTVIIAKVIEIGTSEIKYKRFENSEGPVYVINKSEVRMIKYANGSNDIFSSEKEQPMQITNPVKANNAPQKYKDSATLYAGFSLALGNFASSRGGAAESGWGVGLNGTAGAQTYFSYQVSYANHPYEFNANANGYSYVLAGDYHVWHFLVGVGKRSQPSPTMFYMYIMGGINYLAISGSLAHVGYSDAITFALSPGVGLIVSKNYNIGLKYLHSNATFKNGNSSSYDVEQKISMFQLTGGFQF